MKTKNEIYGFGERRHEVGVRAENRTKWRQLIHCGNP